MSFLGIDLGHTRTKATYADPQGNPQLLRNQQGALFTRSAVFVDTDTVLVGDEAYNAGLVQPDRYADRWKRALGSDQVLCSADGKDYYAKDIARLLIEQIGRDYEQQTGNVLTEVTLSVPAQWTDAQKAETEEAARLAGLDVAIVVHEPTAAVFGNGLQDRGDGIWAILDLGGGTFDVSLVEVCGDTSRVLTTHGDPALGGEDFTDRLVDVALKAFESDHGFCLNPKQHPTAYQELVARAEQAKITLSLRDKAQIIVNSDGHVTTCPVTRDEFESLTQDLVDRAMDCAKQALKQKGLEPDAIREFLPVGGASQTRHFLRAIENTFGKKPSTHCDPFFAVALGAFTLGRLEIERRDGRFSVNGRKLPPIRHKFADVTTHDFGVAIVGSTDSDLVNDVILEKGQPVPSEHTKAFQLSEPNQPSALIQILQGHHGAPAQKCQAIGEFKLEKLTPIPGAHRIDVRMRIDRNGMLTAEAQDPQGDQREELVVDYGKRKAA